MFRLFYSVSARTCAFRAPVSFSTTRRHLSSVRPLQWNTKGVTRVAFSNGPRQRRQKMVDTVLYTASVLVGFLGLTYAAVPLYRLFCQETGFGGSVRTDEVYFDREKMVPRRTDRKLRITFNADTAKSMSWKFRPLQSEVFVHPGETSLVFYEAENPTDKDIIGISTYNVVPLKAGAYFNKIQCFCFEEQKLKAGERIDMPVFFFIDPSFLEDPYMRDVHEITLSYTFFHARTGAPYYPGASTADRIVPAAMN